MTRSGMLLLKLFIVFIDSASLQKSFALGQKDLVDCEIKIHFFQG